MARPMQHDPSMTLDRDTVRRRLLDRQQQLLARAEGARERLGEELDSREIEAVENSQEQWDARMLTHLSGADARQAEAITAALMRLEDDAYGRCIVCGEPIDERRLEAIPEAARCARHEADFEREHNATAILPGA